MLGVESKMHQRVMPLTRFHDDVAALAAIATRRPAPRDKLLAPERHAAIPAVPGLNPNFRLVDEHVAGR